MTRRDVVRSARLSERRLALRSAASPSIESLWRPGSTLTQRPPRTQRHHRSHLKPPVKAQRFREVESRVAPDPHGQPSDAR